MMKPLKYFNNLKYNIMKMEIKIEQGKTNRQRKTFSEMNYNEKRFLNNYIQEVKYGY